MKVGHISQERINACPIKSLLLSHYKEDGTCGCGGPPFLDNVVEAIPYEVLWERIDKALDALDEGESFDPEHQISSHAETLPEAYRKLCAAVRKAKEILQPEEDIIG